MESFRTYMRVALDVDFALAMPVLVYQLVRFPTPGLTRRERRGLFMMLTKGSFMFFVGVLFALFVVIPRALKLLSQFAIEVIEPQLQAVETMTLMLWVGIAFETPIVILLLTKLGIVSVVRLDSDRRLGIVLVMVATAIITPTPDAFTMLTVGLPMYALFEFSLLLARFAR